MRQLSQILHVFHKTENINKSDEIRMHSLVHGGSGLSETLTRSEISGREERGRGERGNMGGGRERNQPAL